MDQNGRPRQEAVRLAQRSFDVECGAPAAERPYPPSHRPGWRDLMSTASAGRRSMQLIVLALTAALLACGGGGSSSDGVTNPPPPPPPPPQANGSTTDLTVSNNRYSPANDSVAVGAMLTWTWNSCTGDGYGGTACTSHSVKFDDGPASPIQDGGTFKRTFATAGTYTYHCAVHGTAMAGKVIVQ
jgi:plastocyanin